MGIDDEDDELMGIEDEEEEGEERKPLVGAASS